MGNPKTERDAGWAQRKRLELILLLGTECALCRLRPKDPAKLQIDHVDGKMWRANALSQRGRVRRYWEEYKAGVRLRSLCRGCNEKDGLVRANR